MGAQGRRLRQASRRLRRFGERGKRVRVVPLRAEAGARTHVAQEGCSDLLASAARAILPAEAPRDERPVDVVPHAVGAPVEAQGALLLSNGREGDRQCNDQQRRWTPRPSRQCSCTGRLRALEGDSAAGEGVKLAAGERAGGLGIGDDLGAGTRESVAEQGVEVAGCRAG